LNAIEFAAFCVRSVRSITPYVSVGYEEQLFTQTNHRLHSGRWGNKFSPATRTCLAGRDQQGKRQQSVVSPNEKVLAYSSHMVAQGCQRWGLRTKPIKSVTLVAVGVPHAAETVDEHNDTGFRTNARHTAVTESFFVWGYSTKTAANNLAFNSKRVRGAEIWVKVSELATETDEPIPFTTTRGYQDKRLIKNVHADNYSIAGTGTQHGTRIPCIDVVLRVVEVGAIRRGDRVVEREVSGVVPYDRIASRSRSGFVAAPLNISQYKQATEGNAYVSSRDSASPRQQRAVSVKISVRMKVVSCGRGAGAGI
jgi:hypothetical protein